MPWVRAEFKEKEVWAEVDADGRLKSDGRLVSIRYSKAPGAKIYKGTAELVRLGGAPPEDIAGGGAGRGSGFGSAGSRTAAQAEAARQDAARRIGEVAEGTHLCFTDGSCKGNPGPAGAGAVVKLADGRVLEKGRYLGVATNNIGELTAVGMAVDLLVEAGVSPGAPVVIYMDSQYAFGVLAKGWKAKANVELIADLKAKLAPWKKGLKLEWVAGHVGIPENERADALANAAITRRA